MSFRRTFLAALAALPLLAACSDGALTSPAPAESKAPTAVLDPVTGEPRSLTTMTADREFIVPASAIGTLPGLPDLGGARLATTAYSPVDECYPDDPFCQPGDCDPAVIYGCQPCDVTNPEHWCYEPPCTVAPIISPTIETVKTGDDPYHSLEASGNSYEQCGGYRILRGVGMRMDGHYNLTTLWLKYQRIYSDGTFGPTTLYKYGSNPTAELEADGEVTEGNAIIGVGVGSQRSENVRTLHLWYRAIGPTADGLRTYGAIPPPLTRGYEPTGALDTQYVLGIYDTNKVYVGLGARAADAEVKTLHHYIGTLN